MATKTIQTWLNRFKLGDDFLEPKFYQLSDHNLIKDRDVFIDRIIDAIRLGQHVVVFGDYDVDGSCGTVILTEAIRSLGGRVTPTLASRFSGGGYGFSDIACDKVLSLNPSLVITVDCGGSDAPRIERLNAAGVDCLVLDHHVVPETKLPALAFLNPHQPGCPSTFKSMCSGGLAFSVVGGLRKKLGAEHILLNDYLDLVALSTVADVMPLTGDNRILVRKGLTLLQNPSRPGMAAVYEITNFKPEGPLTGREIGFRISPALNAPGRLGDPSIVLDLLMEKDPARAKIIAQQVVDLWNKRREDTDKMTEECLGIVRSEGFDKDHAIVVGRDEWNHGIVGIVAARVVETFGKPVCVLGEHGRGSLRGPPGSQLHSALLHCKDTLVKFGGHQAAAGGQVEWSRVSEYRYKFNEFFSDEGRAFTIGEGTQNIGLKLDPADDPLTVCNELQKLEPCGQGNPRPILMFTGQVKSHKILKEKHLKLELILPSGLCIGAFGVNMAEFADNLAFGSEVLITGDLRKNTWNNRTKAEIFMSSISMV